MRAVQKELLLKPRNNPWKIPIYNTLSWSRLSTIVRRHKKDRSSCSQFFIKKRLQHRFFPVNIAKFLRTAFFNRPPLVAASGKRLKFHINLQKGLKKTSEWFVWLFMFFIALQPYPFFPSSKSLFLVSDVIILFEID